jgi:pimeloyl-ACP methyl ester carboxylesterase
MEVTANQNGALEANAPSYDRSASRYVVVGGTRIHYCVEGRGPTLLLLHGLLGSLHAWDGWVQTLASSYRIVRIDLPGFGLSDHSTSDDYTPEHAIELIEQLRRHLHLERFHLAGSSLGGFFAWYYAAHHPERVEKLVLLDPIGYPQKLPPLVALLSLPGMGELAGHLTPRFLLERQLQEAYGDPTRIDGEVRERYRHLIARSKNRRAMIKTFRRLRAYKDDFELSKYIQRVRAPTLLMWGERDRWVPIGLLSAWRRDLPSAKVVTYPEAGHFPMEELPEQTARDVHAFLSDGATVERVSEPSFEVVPFVYARGA